MSSYTSATSLLSFEGAVGRVFKPIWMISFCYTELDYFPYTFKNDLFASSVNKLGVQKSIPLGRSTFVSSYI